MFLSKISKLWKVWELRTLVLISLSIQVLLILFGSHRKRIVTKWVSLLLWLGYLLADSVATLALGVLSHNGDSEDHSSSANQNNDDLLAFWSPFLLLHLGGPDTITAFSLEDNELWLRHFLGLNVQVGVAFYIFIRTLSETKLPGAKLWLVTILMFIAGIIKYSERTWALMVASRDNFRESMVTAPDPGPNYAKFMEEYCSKKSAGLKAEIVCEPEPRSQLRRRRRLSHGSNYVEEESKIISDEDLIFEAHRFFQIFKRLIVDLILTFHDRNESQSFFMKRSWDQAYKVIEIELGFVYEVLYTKAAVIHTLTGCILRIFSASSITSAFIIFYLSINKINYSKIEVVITYVLLGGAIALEIWSLTRLVFSEWTIIWMKKKNLNQLSTLLFRVVSYFRPIDQPRWSNSMAQYNLIKFCIKDQSSIVGKMMKLIHVKEIYDKFWYRTYIGVTDDLKTSIFEDLNQKLRNATDSTSYKYFSTCRGELALQMIDYYDDILDRSIKVEFDESILLWHIATDICYFLDDGDHHKEINSEKILSNQRKSRAVSNYLLYLLVSRPFMLTAGIGQIRFGDTCAEAKNFFHRLEIEIDESQACRKLHEVDTQVPPIEVKGDRSKSVLFDASRLAKSLLKLDIEKRWEMMSLVWFEMLYYTASHCRGNYHGQRLSLGGELLTVVWFLMVHLGIGEQNRVESGHARAKLIVDM
ncbi:uncharacterized protein LOC122668349 [Telopea speciosissima]|uniref:uncharacterized protein LOC122668349 n=1 Tax=Telopea speciosissima TaxID=54955 RepID=UPI001CC7E570|nr:uncharacterized protein LOC122668349 [Telopea speciosissima]